MNNLETKAFELRKKVMDVCYKTQSGHPSSALSCVEILTALYYDGIMRFDAATPNVDDRDRFILSKGHACILQYVILSDLGLITESELYKFCKMGSFLGGHINSQIVPGTDYSAGSLGHGLSYGVGQALNFKYRNKDCRVFVLLGDGECQEGSIWEAALFAGNKNLNNLTVIVDHNGLQASDYVKNISDISPLIDKWRAFGFETMEIDGHNLEEVRKSLIPNNELIKPKAIIAHTKKGKGVSLMENKNRWHAKRPNSEQWKEIEKELGME